MVQGKINRGRNTDHPDGRHSIRTKKCPPLPSPHFLQAACSSCRPTNSVKALKANAAAVSHKQMKIEDVNKTLTNVGLSEASVLSNNPVLLMTNVRKCNSFVIVKIHILHTINGKQLPADLTAKLLRRGAS